MRVYHRQGAMTPAPPKHSRCRADRVSEGSRPGPDPRASATWVLLDGESDIHFQRDGVPLSALELHEAVRTDGDESAVMVRRMERREAPMAPRIDPQPREGTIYSYWWVCWPQRQNPFTHPQFAARKRLMIFDNEAFRTTTWYRSPPENLQKHRAYAARAFVSTTDEPRST